MVKPIAVDRIRIRSELLENVKLRASMDKGCTLTKILYTETSDELKSKGEVILVCESYVNENLVDGLKSMVANMEMPSNPSEYYLQVTGVGGENDQNIITANTPFKVKFIEEFYSQNSGYHFLIQNVDLNEICYPQNEFASKSFAEFDKSGMWEKMAEKVKAQMNIKVTEGLYPCAVAFMGSALGVMKLNEDGTTKLVGGSWCCGKSLLGLGQLMLGTNNYDEIMELASKGNRGNVDTQVKDILSGRDNSTYGQMDPEFCIFSLGKAVDLDKNVSEFNKEDLADSLVSIICGSVFTYTFGLARTHNLNTVFLGGNLCRHPIVRKKISEMYNLMGAMMGMKLYVLKTGHTAAVGAMMAEEGKENTVIGWEAGKR